ncbi:MAG TPA: hypothetical protein EYG79_02610 [Rhodobacteraceae bacterium]|nr:hypothetical protein [Paracoccaceae bacterium]
MKYLQINHPLDLPYENDLNGVRTKDPKVQAALNQMVDIACMGATPAKLQRDLAHYISDPNDLFEIGYVFGFLDAHKTFIWKVSEFNRSFFHIGFRSYFENWELTNIGLLNAVTAISGNDTEFMHAVQIGKVDALRLLEEGAHPNGLRMHFRTKN